jgi:hypothetical protein
LTYYFQVFAVLKESSILLAFVVVSPFVPFLMIGLSLIQPIFGYAQRVVLIAIQTAQGSESNFVMDISNYARAELIHGLFAGFMSGAMFALALVKWIEQRPSRPRPPPVS